jgi:hypothetical protein
MLQKTISVVRHRENVAGLQQVQTDGVVKTSPVRIAKYFGSQKSRKARTFGSSTPFKLIKREGGNLFNRKAVGQVTRDDKYYLVVRTSFDHVLMCRCTYLRCPTLDALQEYFPSEERPA